MCENSICDPMSFLYLDMLSTLLIKEIEDIGQEYDNKISFIRAQEYACLENNKHLILVDQLLSKLKECLSYTELELEETNMGLIEAEKVILCYEQACYNLSPPMPVVKPSNYLCLVKLILSADCSASKCNNIREQIEDFNKETAEHLGPYHMIAKLIDIHVKSLKWLEDQVNHMQKLVAEVTDEHEEIAKKLDISSLSMKCNCNMASIVNDMHLDKA